MIDIPVAARDFADKAAYCYRVIERLRLWHNEVGAKVDVKDGKALAEFRTWVREQWEPRHKAACLTLHSLDGFTQLVPAEYDAARQKQAAKVALSPAETAALKTMDDRQAAKITAKADTNWDADIDLEKIPRLGVVGEPPDPTEDFTTYTEVDPNGHIAITSASLITCTLMARGESCYVYADKGVGHFAGDFTHLVDALVSARSSYSASMASFWGVGNAVGDVNTRQNGGDKMLDASWLDGNSGNTAAIFYLIENNEAGYDVSILLTLNTT